MAVRNEHGLDVWVKPEDDKKAIRRVTREGYPGKQDGIVLPKVRPGEVFKSVDNIDIVINKDGSITLEPAAGLPENLLETVKSLIEASGQLIKGGWYKKPTNEMKRSKRWLELFKKSKKNTPKPPPVSSPARDRGHRRHNRNHDFFHDARSRGISIGRGGGIPDGTVTITDLN